jgi:hypothetical protein
MYLKWYWNISGQPLDMCIHDVAGNRWTCAYMMCHISGHPPDMCIHDVAANRCCMFNVTWCVCGVLEGCW